MQASAADRVGRDLAAPAPGRLTLADGTVVGLARDEREGRVAIAACGASGGVIGRVGFTRVYGPRATVTIEIDDDHWHRGLAGALLARLCEDAACRGISTFLVRAPATDVRLLALLREQFAARGAHNGALVDAEFGTAAPARSAVGQPARG